MNTTAVRPRSGIAVAILCFLTIVADGYDMVVYGAALPKILDEPGWNLSHATAGLIGTWTLAGLMVGFLTAGPLTDRIGRRKLMLTGVLWISAGSPLSAVAMNVEVFGVARFLTGVGIGSVVPSAVAADARVRAQGAQAVLQRRHAHGLLGRWHPGLARGDLASPAS